MTDARPRIAVVDYGAGNLVSIEQGLTASGADVVIARDAPAFEGADAVVVPGVGAAAPAFCAAVRFLGASFGAGSALASGAPPMLRRLTFSTTTCLLRPWLKLWRTTPCSTPRLSVSLPETLSFFSPGFFVSLIP